MQLLAPLMSENDLVQLCSVPSGGIWTTTQLLITATGIKGSPAYSSTYFSQNISVGRNYSGVHFCGSGCGRKVSMNILTRDRAGNHVYTKTKHAVSCHPSTLTNVTSVDRAPFFRCWSQGIRNNTEKVFGPILKAAFSAPT